ncbi:DUF397 domain-containing protein [Streptomyces umbrinus]
MERGACVEVALHLSALHIRDSKLNPIDGAPELTVPASAWAEFVAYVGA